MVMKEVKASITMSRTLYIEVLENSTEEQILEKAKQEIILPFDALQTANKALRQMRVNIPKLDLVDWAIDDLNYKVN